MNLSEPNGCTDYIDFIGRNCISILYSHIYTPYGLFPAILPNQTYVRYSRSYVETACIQLQHKINDLAIGEGLVYDCATYQPTRVSLSYSKGLWEFRPNCQALLQCRQQYQSYSRLHNELLSMPAHHNLTPRI